MSELKTDSNFQKTLAYNANRGLPLANRLNFLRPITTYTTPENTTLSKQKELKSFGVPSLQETIPKYLKSVQPFLTGDEMKKTEQIAQTFSKSDGVGPKLQTLLEERAKSMENWFADWWLDRAYLGYRGPITVWSSPGMVFPKQTFQSDTDQLDFAARLISGLLDYKMLLDKQCLPIEYFGKLPMDMEQYYVQFGACRIPGQVKDTLDFNPNSNHITVVHNNEFFKMQVMSDEGIPVSEKDIFGSLSFILKESKQLGKNEHPIGVLTASERDDWFQAYQVLMPGNESSIKDIQSSLFVLALDDDTSGNYPDSDQARIAAQAIHGLGTKQMTGNRWFDKTLQFFVGRSGECGMTIEHSTAEALAPMGIASHAMHCINGGIKFTTETAQLESVPKHLPIVLNDEAKNLVKNAESKVDVLINDMDASVLHFKSFGKSFIKNQKLGPDSFVQMAMQYAFYRIHNAPGAHYESGGLRVYRHGRTDIIRSCSVESIKFAQKMLDKNASNADKMLAMSNAINMHQQYAKMACQGKGIDRHLLGLQIVAHENNIEVPDFFDDYAYMVSSTHRISSSNVSSPQELVVCFGPLVMDGYGCCYNIRDYDLIFGITDMKSFNETSANQYKEALEDSLHEMHDLAVAYKNMANM